MKHGANLPRSAGQASRQAHADLPPGTYERELGREGFFGPASQMYHRHPPTGWSAVDGPLRPRAFDLSKLAASQASPWQAPEVLANSSISLRFWRLDSAMTRLARNADGDDLLFIHEGRGALFCDYGHLSYEAGDYIVMPRGTQWRLEPATPAAVLMIEATNGAYRQPDKGLLGRHAIYDPAVLDLPEIDETFVAQQSEEPWTVEVKRRGQVTSVNYPFNPLDAIGWHGDLAPLRLNVRDIRPVMSHRYHLPPSAHSTFVADRFVVCTFAPRPFESDPGALKVPFFHNNDDYDEVLFYHAGDFFSRDNIHPGMMTFHPSGLPHGPHPKALAGMFEPKVKATEEYAVMIDARDPLEPGTAAAGVEWPGYVDSWKDS